MTTPTREQVVQCKGENCKSTDGTNHSVECLYEHFIAYRGLNAYSQEVKYGNIKAAYFDGYTAARADLEAELESLRKDAVRWRAVELLMFIGDVELVQHEDGGYRISVDPVENIVGKCWYGNSPEEAIDAAIAAAPKEK